MHFKSYLRFKPDAGGAAWNIWVTLGVVNWSWTAAAWYTDSTWHLSNFCPPPSFEDSIEPPVYTRVLVNGFPFE
jgi:hypothetical protein